MQAPGGRRERHRVLKGSAFILILLLLAGIAKADAPKATGYYSAGSLINPVDLLGLRSPHILLLFPQRKRTFATTEMIQLIEALALRTLQRGFERLQLGDLSNFRGGKAEGHGSHQNGLDADIVYLSQHRREQVPGKPYWSEWFVDKGLVTKNFDLQRNWEAVKWLSRQPLVQRIFVDGAIKDALCRHARLRGELGSETRTLRILSRENSVHKTHFHLRLSCPPGHTRCLAQPPPASGPGC